ncbi:MAG TPA: hypothetical protein VG028_08245 [Terriglobia bacterium]|nr:hypothetical protein [Terriglobia bacterium]
MPEGSHRETAVVVEKTYDFLLWLLPKVEKFPRSFRFSAGDRSENPLSPGRDRDDSEGAQHKMKWFSGPIGCRVSNAS